MLILVISLICLRTHLQDDCSDAAFSGQWQRNGCMQVGDDASIHTFCSGKDQRNDSALLSYSHY